MLKPSFACESAVHDFVSRTAVIQNDSISLSCVRPTVSRPGWGPNMKVPHPCVHKWRDDTCQILSHGHVASEVEMPFVWLEHCMYCTLTVCLLWFDFFFHLLTISDPVVGCPDHLTLPPLYMHLCSPPFHQTRPYFCVDLNSPAQHPLWDTKRSHYLVSPLLFMVHVNASLEILSSMVKSVTRRREDSEEWRRGGPGGGGMGLKLPGNYGVVSRRGLPNWNTGASRWLVSCLCIHWVVTSVADSWAIDFRTFCSLVSRKIRKNLKIFE